MDEISKHDFQPETPCIKVVGVGETVAPVIESLKDNWKGDIDAGMADECKPADTDIMAIVVSDGDAETTHKVIASLPLLWLLNLPKLKASIFRCIDLPLRICRMI